MTDAELWPAVGRVLEQRRLDRRWRPMTVERAGGPTYKTVQAIEAGKVGAVESLARYCQTLDLSLVDVLRGVLDPGPMSPEHALFVRLVSALSPDALAALAAVAQLLPITQVCSRHAQGLTCDLCDPPQSS